MAAKPFRVKTPDSVLNDLRNRLRHTRWADDVRDAGWNFGTSLEYLKELVDYWQRTYDWRKHEAEINAFRQFKADVGGVGIHFIHETSKNPDAMPLLLLHGWPDSFYRFHKVIPMLTKSFHLVVPSLPGFGFSERKAMSKDSTAEVMARLMADLGYTRYAAAGGDIGSGVAMALAVMHPAAVVGIHLTDVGYPTGQEDFSTMSEAERTFAGFIQQWWYTEGAYAMVQGTKPQTVAQGLNDSPAGLAAWIVSFIDTGAKDHRVEEAFGSRDELLTNITIYWVTETVNSAARTYLENVRAAYAPGGPKSAQRSMVPAAVALFPREAPLPREWAERCVNLQRFTKMPHGGHFAALEEPELYAKDIQEFFAGLKTETKDRE